MGETTPHTPAPSPTDEHAAAMEALQQQAAANTQPTNFKVIIIGAGMAGLSAANHLMQNGCDSFCLLEARSRIGGRIVSIPLAQQKVRKTRPLKIIQNETCIETYVRPERKEKLFLFHIFISHCLLLLHQAIFFFGWTNIIGRKVNKLTFGEDVDIIMYRKKSKGRMIDGYGNIMNVLHPTFA